MSENGIALGLKQLIERTAFALGVNLTGLTWARLQIDFPLVLFLSLLFLPFVRLVLNLQAREDLLIYSQAAISFCRYLGNIMDR